jgi:hypothetical protein
VGFVQDDDDASSAFVFLGGEQFGGLRDEHRLLVAGGAAQGQDDPGVEATGSDGRVGQVDDGGAACAQGGQGGADRDGPSCPDLAGDDPEGPFGEAPADPGDGLGPVQHLWGQGLAERRAGEAVVGLQVLDGHRDPSLSSVRSGQVELAGELAGAELVAELGEGGQFGFVLVVGGLLCAAVDGSGGGQVGVVDPGGELGAVLRGDQREVVDPGRGGRWGQVGAGVGVDVPSDPVRDRGPHRPALVANLQAGEVERVEPPDSNRADAQACPPTRQHRHRPTPPTTSAGRGGAPLVACAGDRP